MVLILRVWRILKSFYYLRILMFLLDTCVCLRRFKISNFFIFQSAIMLSKETIIFIYAIMLSKETIIFMLMELPFCTEEFDVNLNHVS